jgi:hypothetical protein
LFADSIDIPAYPYAQKYDSLQNAIKQDIKKQQENNPDELICYFEPQPEMYAVVDDNKYTVSEYLQHIKLRIPKDSWIVIKLRIEWNGIISEAKIHVIENDNWDRKLLIDIIRKLKSPTIKFCEDETLITV